ncbi:putative secondary metabolism biosynthetic enzyme [Marasmius tenuissimus]|nr:putative secondary metabolism biosynthetic enzyme [Marasmius tenuissimus]
MASTTFKKPTTHMIHRTPWRPPVATSAEGIYIELEDGRKIVDAVGGAAVACLGMSHPVVCQAMRDQLDKLPCSEAMEGVIKTSRQYYEEIGQPKRKNFISRKLSYHGNTVATLSLSYHPGRRAPYEAILNHDNFHHVSPAYAARFQNPDETEEQYVERLKKELEDKFIELGPDTVIGFVAETVVGATTGAVPAPKGYFKAMKEVCHKYGALFILDEVSSVPTVRHCLLIVQYNVQVMSGMGRKNSLALSRNTFTIWR